MTSASPELLRVLRKVRDIILLVVYTPFLIFIVLVLVSQRQNTGMKP